MTEILVASFGNRGMKILSSLFEPVDPRGWAKSRALIAQNVDGPSESSTCILYSEGSGIAVELDATSVYDVTECFSDAPKGLSVWIWSLGAPAAMTSLRSPTYV
jgi:hypothetical protein